MLSAIKVRYDRFDKLREDTLKRSRDIIKSAKNAIFSLQRGTLNKADAEIAAAVRVAVAVHQDLVSHTPSLRRGLFSAAMEELAEAVAYRAFRFEHRMLSRAELQAASGLPFPVTLVEYLGGMFDLTGEVCRLAVRSAQAGHKATQDVERCLACVDGFCASLQRLSSLPGGLGKKVGALRGSQTKIEGVLYELALLTRGGMKVQAPAGGHHEHEADNADEGVA